MNDAAFRAYLAAVLAGDFTKLARLEFFDSSGAVAYALDNNAKNQRSGAFLQSGSLSVNMQNGRRREMDAHLSNLDDAFSFAVNHIWFGQKIRYSEGLLLPSGEEFYIPQGVFEIEGPSADITPTQRTVTYHLVDKWANLDGTLHGTLDGDYKVLAGTNIFQAMASILRLGLYDLESGSSKPIDSITPLFTTYYNGKTQTLTDGTIVPLLEAPYDMLKEGGGTLADVMLGLAEMLAAWVGYDPMGRMTVSPSQDDILDTTKPVQWTFREDQKQILSIKKNPKVTEVFNDVIVVGATSGNNYTARGRAQNLNPASSTCISRIGLKTKRIPMQNYYSDDICEAYAEWQLKRMAALQESVSIECQQIFHLRENDLIEVIDKNGKSTRYLVQGFTRPVAQTGSMTINAVSVNDLEVATLIA